MKRCPSTSWIESLEDRIAPAAVLYLSLDGDANGLFQIDPATGAATKIGASGATGATVGLTESTNSFVLFGSGPTGLIKINADGSGATVIGNTIIEALATDPATGVLYGGRDGDFFTVDPVTGAQGAALSSPGTDLEALSYGGVGKLFGINSLSNTLLSYDIAGNAWTPIGPVGVDIDFPGLAFDPVASVLYASGSQDGNLYRIDPTTGLATLIAPLGFAGSGGLALIDNGLKLVNAKTATYKDGNGDLVTVKVTLGSLDASNFLLVPAPNGGAELWRLDLSAAEFAGTSVTITATKTKTAGDGRAHVGYLNAGTNDLGKVTIPGDLARIVAGDGNATKPAVAALTVGSMGVVDLSQNLGLDQVSSFNGNVGSLTIRGDFDGKQIAVAGNLGPLVVSGSMLGGATALSGEIFAVGTIQSATIGGSIVGGDGASSARIFAGGNLGPVKVSGAVQGGDGNESGEIVSNASIASLTIGKSLIGGAGTDSGEVFANFTLGPVKIGGGVFGGDGTGSGRLFSNGSITSASIAESVVGGDGSDSGEILALVGNVGALKIGDSLIGGTGTLSGRVIVGGNAASLSLGGSLMGGDGTSSGRVEIGGNLGAAKIRGSIIGGEGTQSANLRSNTSVAGNSGAVSIGGDIVGGADSTALVWARLGSFKSVTLGGSLLGGEAAFSGGILAEQNLGAVLIKGSVLGDAAQDVTIRAGGLLTVASGATKNVAMSLTVLGSVEHAQILVGFANNNAEVNGGVQVGAVKVGGSWSQSSILVGHNDGTDNLIGTADDTRIVGGPAGIVARIASITIGGAISGTYGGADHFGFVATQIGAFKAGGLTAPLTPLTNVVEVGFFTGDVTVREIA